MRLIKYPYKNIAPLKVLQSKKGAKYFTKTLRLLKYWNHRKAPSLHDANLQIFYVHIVGLLWNVMRMVLISLTLGTHSPYKKGKQYLRITSNLRYCYCITIVFSLYTVHFLYGFPEKNLARLLFRIIYNHN